MVRLFLAFVSATVLLCHTPLSFGALIVVPEGAPTIQAGIDTAVNGDTVLVNPGVYFENISFRGKNVVVASRFLLTRDPATIRQTIIDGSQPLNSDSGSVVRITRPVDSTAMLCGFTLRNGIGTLIPGSFAGGGILISGGGSPKIRYNIIHNNGAIVGGGIAVRTALPFIEHNALAFNNASKGGGLLLENTTISLDHNVFHQNNAQIHGGAVWGHNATVKFTNNSVTHNTSVSASAVLCSLGTWTFDNNNFFGNSSPEFSLCGEPSLGDISQSKNFNLDSADVYNNIRKAPRYINPAERDFALNCDSRLIDAGYKIPPTYPVGGIREDIGMFEYNYRTADLNDDGRINLVDATILVNVIFQDFPLPCPLFAADCDCSRRVNITDIIAMINYWTGFSETSCLFTPTGRAAPSE